LVVVDPFDNRITFDERTEQPAMSTQAN